MSAPHLVDQTSFSTSSSIDDVTAELDAIANGDATKLPNGTPEEQFQRTFYKTMQDRVVAKKKKAAQTVVSQLATHGLGAKKYNAIKKAYRSDSSIKAKVDGLMSSMTAE